MPGTIFLNPRKPKPFPVFLNPVQPIGWCQELGGGGGERGTLGLGGALSYGVVGGCPPQRTNPFPTQTWRGEGGVDPSKPGPKQMKAMPALPKGSM